MTVAASDETRFQVLPTDEEWERFKKLIDYKEMKLLVIDKTYWHNKLTRCKGVVRNIPVLAQVDDSNRISAITKIEVTKYDFETNNYDLSTEWKFNQDYAHINISDCTESLTLKDNGCNGRDDDKWEYSYKIFYQRICCPITQYHFYKKPLDELKMILTGQLQGQNSGSPFRTVCSVANNYEDKPINDIYGQFIKRTAPVIQLISRQSMYDIQNRIRQGRARELLNRDLPRNDDEVMVKLISDDHYTIANKKSLEDDICSEQISAYYQPITYQDCKNILDNLPKIERDLICIGLGSAGTGILDQICRSNWFSKFLLVDFDTVEKKNLRNQWYTMSNVGNSKVSSSEVRIKNARYIDDTPADVISINNKFQEAGLDSFSTKYIVSGFDSIECRLELLDYIEQGKVEAQYLIDTRYDDLDASVFIIDTKDEKQMAYYRKGLESDKEAFDKQKAEAEAEAVELTWEEFYDYLKHNSTFTNSCGEMHHKLNLTRNCNCSSCNGDRCKQYWKEVVFDNNKEKCARAVRGNNETEISSCVKQNLIDIYKFASSFVFSAIREIEDGEPKPFTHIEVTTNKMPNYMVVRK